MSDNNSVSQLLADSRLAFLNQQNDTPLMLSISAKMIFMTNTAT